MKREPAVSPVLWLLFGYITLRSFPPAAMREL